MKNILAASVAIGALSAGAAFAGGIDRSNQPIGALFESGNYFELGYGQIRPDVSGTFDRSLGVTPGTSTGNVLRNYDLPSIALKYDFNDKLSGLLQYDHAYGADVLYPGAPGTGISGTEAVINSDSITALLRYKFDENWAIHGGIRAAKSGGYVRIYAPVSGVGVGQNIYNADLHHAWGTGFILGGSYEIPDIALRATLTYFSEVDHDMNTIESGLLNGGRSIASGDTTVTTPQAVNFDLQSGIAEDTLAFFQFRWADWSEFKIAPARAVATRWPVGLVNFEDSYTYTLGVGRKFNENWSGSVFLTYEDAGDDQTTAFSPYSGYKGIGAGVVYTQDQVKVTAGVRYMDLGDAFAQTGGDANFNGATKVGQFSGNHAVAFQVKVGYKF